MPQPTNPKDYLGDSVYAEYEPDTGMIVLTTDNGYADDPRNLIYLDSDVFAKLIRFLDTVKAGKA